MYVIIQVKRVIFYVTKRMYMFWQQRKETKRKESKKKHMNMDASIIFNNN